MSIFDLTQAILDLEEVLDEALGEVPKDSSGSDLNETEDALESKVESYRKLVEAYSKSIKAAN